MPGFPNDQSNPAGAIPVYVTSGGGGGLTPVDYSTTLNTGASTVADENASRKYLFIQCVTPGQDIWVDLTGSAAAPEQYPSFKLAAGQTYESGTYVLPGAVSIYVSADNVGVTVVEG